MKSISIEDVVMSKRDPLDGEEHKRSMFAAASCADVLVRLNASSHSEDRLRELLRKVVDALDPILEEFVKQEEELS